LRYSGGFRERGLRQAVVVGQQLKLLADGHMDEDHDRNSIVQFQLE
jgi:hypothetical protein